MGLRLKLLILFATVTNCCSVSGRILDVQGSIYVQPQQIHLSVAENTKSFIVTWSTLNSTNVPSIGGSWVEYGTNPRNLNQISYDQETKFTDGGNEHSVQFIHRSILGPLTSSMVYYYRVGSNITMSDLYLFRTFPNYNSSMDNWSPHIAIYGDMGNVNAQSLPRLQRETQSGMYDMILHVGDFAYDMDTDNAHVGDEFMRQIESIAAYTPYMTCPGNHESAYNFSNYKARFTMPEDDFGHKPDQGKDMFYSFDLGPIHFVSINTEYYYYQDEPWNFKQCVLRQYDWLKNDLQEANKAENRRDRPWIVVFGHRPMYCTGADHDDCVNINTVTRVGSDLIPNTEQLLMENNVDVAIWAHEHNYERFWPMYNYTVMNGTTKKDQPYNNARAPLHIITGSAGCQEEKEDFKPDKPYYSAFRDNDYGFTRLKAHNKTHLEFSQVSDDKDGAIIDHFFVVKNFEPSSSDILESTTERDLHHYSLKPHHEMLKRMNQKQKEKKKFDFYPFPIIEIIS